MNQGFGENDFGAGQVAEFEVAGRILRNLLPESTLKLQEMMVDSWADHFQSIIHISQPKQCLALNITLRNIDGVQCGREIVEYTEEIIVVTYNIIVGVCRRVALWYMRGRLHGGKVCH